MPLPFIFTAGEVARAEEQNTNNQYLVDLIGQTSGGGSIEGQSQFILGPRQIAIITARQDTGPNANAFVQHMWNASWTLTGGVYKFARILPNQPASAFRLGRGGLSFMTTSATTGDLNTQMTTIWGLTATQGADYMYLKDNVHIQNVNEVADSLQEYRLTRVFMETPIKIYNGPVSKATNTFNAYNLGVPSSAKGVIIYAHVTPANPSGAGMHFYQKRAVSVTDVDRARGFVVHGYSGNTASGRVGGQGDVPLSSVGEFVIERTAAFALAKVYIMGYLT